MSKLYVLFSSSAGNAAFFGSPAGGILIDDGVSYRRLLESLRRFSIPPIAIAGILVTHNHADHVQGLRVLLKNYPVPLYATQRTLGALSDLPANAQTQEVSLFEPFKAGDITVTPFPTMHDAPGSCGYRLQMPDGRCAAICTDLGVVTPAVEEGVYGADLVLLESNYDPDMLKTGPYPYPLRKRIVSDYGHLSNRDSADFAARLLAHGTTRLILGHLSPHNNTPALAKAALIARLQQDGKEENRDFLLEIASPEGLEKAVIF